MIACAATSLIRVFSAFSHNFQKSSAMKIRRLSVAALIAFSFAGLPLAAQSAHFSDATSTLHSGLGSNPVGVAVDGNGNIFASDSGHNTVYEIVASGSYATVKTLGSGFNSPLGVAVDGSGNVFVTDYLNHAVKEILAAGGYTTVNTLGSGFRYPEGIAVDASGNVFVADTGHSAVKEIVAAGGYTTVNTLGSGFHEPTSVALDGSGNLIVLDDLNNYLYTSVKEIMAAGGYTTVNTLIPNSSVPAFCCAAGVAVDRSGNVYLSTDHFGPQYTISEILAVNGSIPASPVIISRGSGLFMPTGLAVDGSGNIFVGNQEFGGVADMMEITSPRGNFNPVNVGSTGLYRTEFVFTFDAGGTLPTIPYRVLTQGAENLDFSPGAESCGSGAVVKTGDTCMVSVNFKPMAPGPRYGAVELFGSTGNLLATAYVQGTGIGPLATFADTTTEIHRPGAQTILGSGLNLPQGAAVDGKGNVFVGDYGNNAVKEILATGGYTTVKTLGSGFNGPVGVAVDGGGNVFVADYLNNAVKEILAAGGYTTVKTLGSGFNAPAGVALDGSGNVFVADAGHNAVKEILAASGYATVKTLGSGFSYPEGVALDGSGNVFVADYLNSAVKEIVAASGYSNVITLGSGFSYPVGVAVDASGNVFVADSTNNQVKEIPASCIAGANNSTCALTLGSGFSFPTGVAVDGSGNVFVADNGDSRVVKLDFADPPALNFATTPVGSQSSDSPRMVTVSNNGNAALTFPIPVSGNNPSVSTGFTLGGATTCPQLSTSSSAATLASAMSCGYAVDFIPVTAGTDSGSLTLTDNHLNAGSPGYATQSIGLVGIGGITPAITWSTPAAISYGTALSVAQLDATSTVAGTFTYTPAAGTILGAGAQTLSVTLTPTDTIHYLAATKTVSLTVSKVKPALTWSTPAAITYGTTLSVTQLNAAASVPGVYVYSPSTGAVPAAGSHVLWVTFTPTDSTDYATRIVSVTLTVNKVVLTVTAKNANRVYGVANPTLTDAITGFVLGQGLGALSGTASLTTTATAASVVGSYPIVAAQGTLAAVNYTFKFVNGTLTVNKAKPGLTWATPKAITYGTALSATQLNAAALVPGVYVYSPASGAAPAVGTHTLWATFTPADSTDYASLSISVTLTVNKAVLTVTANNASRAHGAANPAFADTVTGFVLGQTKSVLSGTASLTTTATTTSPAGSYPIVAAQGTLAAVNYTFKFINGTLTVTQ
jgi:sugar lactone lactonase YvrE